MNREKILELDIDIESIISKSVQLKSSLESMRSDMAKLKQSGDNSSEGFVKLEAAIKKTSSEYNKNQQQLSNLVAANSKFITVQDKVNLSIDKEITSIAAARANNTELLKIRNELNLKTEAGAKAADQINKKLDENNNFIKENSSQYEKQKINIGNYKADITAALNETGLFNGKLQEFTQIGGAMTGVFGLLKKDFSESFGLITNAARGTDDLSKSQKLLAIATNIGTGAMRIFTLALAATGIGLIIIAIALLVGYFRTFDPLIDAIEQGFAGLSAAVRVLQQFLVGLISSFDKLADFMSDPIGSLQKLGTEMKKAAKEAASLKAAQQDLADAQAIQSIANKKQEGEIARLMLQSKDRGKTEQERIALLQKAEAINRQNFATNSALSDKEMAQAIEATRLKGALSEREIGYLKAQGIAYAYKLLNAGKITQDEVDMLAKAEESKIDIFNRATAEQEKIINRQNLLAEKAAAETEAREKKLQELRQKSLDDAAEKSKAELDLFISEQGYRAKSLQEQISIAETIRDKKLEIADKEFADSEKTAADELKLLTARNNAKDEFLKTQAESVASLAQIELQAVLDKNAQILASDKFLSDELLKQKMQSLDANLAAEKAHQQTLFDQGLLNLQEYNAAIKVIEDKAKADKDALAKKAYEDEQAQKLIDLENKRAAEQMTFEEDLANRQAQLDIQKQQELDAAEKNGADKSLIEAKYAKISKDLEATVQDAKLSLTADFFGQAKGLLKEHTALGKVLGIAEATINTYLGATKALATLPPPFGAIQAGITVATGMAQVAKISGVKFKKGGWLGKVKNLFSRGAVVSGPSHEQGGIDFTVQGQPGFNMEGDEIILTKGVARNPALRALASQINVAGGGVQFAGGGIPHPTSGTLNTINNTIQSAAQPINYDVMAAKIADANRSLPPGRIAIEDINTGQGNYAEVIQGADL